MKRWHFHHRRFCEWVAEYYRYEYAEEDKGLYDFALDSGVGSDELHRILDGTDKIDAAVFMDICFAMDSDPWEFYEPIEG